MTRKSKLKRILSGIQSFDDEASGIFNELDSNLSKASEAIKQAVNAKTLTVAQKRFADIRASIERVQNFLNEFKGEITDKIDSGQSDLRESVSQNIVKLLERVRFLEDRLNDNTLSLHEAVEKTQKNVEEVSNRKIVFPDHRPDFKVLEERMDKTFASLPVWASPKDVERVSSDIEELQKDLKKLRTDLLTFAQSRGGGNANRNISIGGNPSVLSRFTDVNLLAGTNVTLSYQDNSTTKNVDVTIAATGGSGTVRSISSIATSQSAGSVAGTDYVYVCTTGLKLTLPTAVSNTNLYTVKNTGTSSVMVDTTGGQTVDGDTNIILATQYTAVDLISDSVGWHIT